MSTKDIPPLVSTAWLFEHLHDPSLIILDSSFKMPGVTPSVEEDYEAAHIKGARFFSIERISDPHSALPHMLPSPDDFREAVEALGIREDSQVVLYDSGGVLGAARAFWMFSIFGHKKLSVLDGGLFKWKQEGKALETHVPTPKRGHFTPHFNPSLLRTKTDLLSNLKTEKEQVIDARAAPRFLGEAPEPRPGLRQGHIPKSLNLDHTTLIKPQDKTMKSVDELREVFRHAGIKPSLPVITTCGSGVSACVLALGLRLIGHGGISVYDGSFAEWGLPSETPVEKGPSPT